MSPKFTIQSALTLIVFFCIKLQSADCLDLNTFLSGEPRAFPGKCVKNIIADNFPCGTTVTIVYTKEEEGQVDPVIRRITEESCCSILTRNFDQQLHIAIVNELYVVVAQDLQEFTIQLAKLTRDPLWNPKASYIVHIHNASCIDDVFKLLSTHHIFNAIMLEGEKNSIIYTYYPFADNSCGSNADVVKIGKCIDNVTVSNLFTNKVLDKERDKSQPCKIRIVANENVPMVIKPGNEEFQSDDKTMLGIEQLMLDIISKDEHFELEYIHSSAGFGNILPNGSHTGLFKYLQNNEADLAMSGFILTLTTGTPYEYIHGHSYIGFYFLVASAGESDWEIVYKEFSSITWVLVAVLYFIVSVICLMIKRLHPWSHEHVGITLKLWGYFFANPNRYLSQNIRLRKILACWIWFAFFMSSFYTTGFYSLMTVKIPMQRIRTDKPPTELYKPCLSVTLRNIFQIMYNTKFPDNANKECEDIENFLNVCAANRDLYCITLVHKYLYEQWKYLDDNGNYKLEAWEYSALITTQAMFVPKGYIFKETLQRHVSYLIESGLVQYQERMINLKVNKAVEAKKKTFKMLELSAIRIAFYVLLFGEGLAFICFLGEHYQYYYTTKGTYIEEVSNEKLHQQISAKKKKWFIPYRLINSLKPRSQDVIRPYVN